MNILSKVRKEVRELQPYKLPNLTYKIKLDIMENPYNLPAEVIQRVKEQLPNLPFNRYPDPFCSELREKLALYLKISKDRIIVGGGSDELIQLILLTFGGTIIYPTPTFLMYGVIGQTLGRKRREIQLNENFDFDTNLFIEEAKSDGGGIIFLAFPNNPTGNCFKKESVLRLIKEADSLVIIDEAYYDFSGETFLPAISDYENLIILRTFSKAFGLAGLRIGYLVSNPEIVRYLFKAKLPFNVNIFSQKVASILLENVELLKDRIKEIIDEREELYTYLRKLNGIHPYPSRCNFILFRTLTTPASKVFDCLAGDGILIRDVSDEGLLKNCLRVTIGSPHENRIFREKISEIFKGS